ncbi:amino acid ABC transporter permease [Zymobacter palmae]|uniref:ABC-type amino acid transport system, permease n=1 Tax=Zymobacter palmae TaxID=33074 RepID=A0A348HHW3_9GAMM|nr:amino acid ABC transporter permease [Zymobacter palmae]BBG31215.1 ABC-type amino acid transport system, permease [Zymobacter palmae]
MTRTIENSVTDTHIVRDDPIAPRPAPAAETGVGKWLRTRLFSSPINSVITLVLLYLVVRSVWAVFSWAFLNASWLGDSSAACTSGGACWPFVTSRIGQLVYGFYPEVERWRVAVAFVIWLLSVVWILVPRMPKRLLVLPFALIGMPIINLILLRGGVFGLESVLTRQWGGLMLTLTVATIGMLFAIPLGVLLALGRQSKMPLVHGFCVVFIELWRGIPMITVLFTASTIFPLFMPHGSAEGDKLLRALIGIVMFWSAYFAEVVRAGLQAVPNGQVEAGKALCLGYWKRNALIVLPQALKLVIPGLVSTAIQLFKDTSLVTIIGLFDFLGVIKAGLTDSAWMGYAAEGYAFAALIYWIFCFSMSRYSLWLERRVDTGRR